MPIAARVIAQTLTVALGAELTKLVPGRVSTEVEAHLSFDVEASVARARSIIADYAERGVPKDRVLIKLSATWEGIRAAEILQSKGIDCNVTLLFSLAQAAACADAGVYLISPFVGRITDWHKKTDSVGEYLQADDPGVQSVCQIYSYYKAHQIETVVMGASFRNAGQIKALSGCDRLTIAPTLLDELSSDESQLDRALPDDDTAQIAKMSLTETEFRRSLNQDPMATEKLSEGIRGFENDFRKLVEVVSSYPVTNA